MGACLHMQHHKACLTLLTCLQYDQPKAALHWLLVAHSLCMDNLIARCERLLMRHIDFLCDAQEAVQLPSPSLLRITKVRCMGR